MKKYKRIFVLVLDSLGIGEMPDAAGYGDAGTNTLGHIAAFRYARGNPLHIPHLRCMGIANLIPLMGIEPCSRTLG